MELGGTRHRGPKVFLLSTTHGGEIHGLAAALGHHGGDGEAQGTGSHERDWGVFHPGIYPPGRAAGDSGILLLLGGGDARPLVETRSHEGKGDLAYRTLFMAGDDLPGHSDPPRWPLPSA